MTEAVRNDASQQANTFCYFTFGSAVGERKAPHAEGSVGEPALLKLVQPLRLRHVAAETLVVLNRKGNNLHIAHVAIWTPDLDRQVAFWQTYFDAEIGEPYHSKRREGFVSRFIKLADTGAEIELMTGPWIDPSEDREASGWDHIAISLGSQKAVDEMAARCKIDGILVSGPRMTGDGYYEAVIATPDGSRVEITS
ncbi:UNVERIFIED_ORG: catechol 2,3-dioxygenase-like lactoylglutathione lyase family enzyme [Rhizobium esperanzae]|uniref:VOC family protein n=1 Tax=Rhizobium phaseoli TaxID=396 RepID=UPI0017CE6325|nr:VOC family protein [Rhizobium phaseoli]MDK4728668.1 VOC family protein [Rhizobium phaseoli]